VPGFVAIPRGDINMTFVLRLDGYARKQIVARADRSIAQKVTLVGLARPAQHNDRDVSVKPFAR
jgi:hypothetical protein